MGYVVGRTQNDKNKGSYVLRGRPETRCRGPINECDDVERRRDGGAERTD